MYTVTKKIEVAGAHWLNLPYESKCSSLHGHNWIIHVTCQAPELNEAGMVVDFTEIKKLVMQLDHANVNNILNQDKETRAEDILNPTAENIARWICDRVPYCIKVSVQESEGNVAVYER